MYVQLIDPDRTFRILEPQDQEFLHAAWNSPITWTWSSKIVNDIIGLWYHVHNGLVDKCIQRNLWTYLGRPFHTLEFQYPSHKVRELKEKSS